MTHVRVPETSSRLTGLPASEAMKILFLTHYFPPEGNAPASRVHEMAKRWVAAGHDVTVITCAPNVPDGVVYDGYRNRLRQRETIDGIEVVRVWTYIAANKGTIRRIVNYVSYMISAVVFGLRVRRPDIVIATSPQFFCGWAGAVLSRLRRRPFILEIRDIWPESILAVGVRIPRLMVRILEWLERRMYACATHVVTVGEGYRSKLREKGVAPERMSIVTNGVDQDRFSPRPPDPDMKQRYALGDRFVCSYVGTIGMASGLDTVLEAATLLRDAGRNDVVFLLVGDGAVRAELEQRAAREDLQSVVFTGRQPKDAVPAFLSVSNACLVHLRKTELFRTVLPSKIFEAAAMGKPIILGVEGCAADLVREADAGICIEPENSEALIAAIDRLRNDADTATRLGANGQRTIAEHYNRDTLARDYLSVIERVVR